MRLSWGKDAGDACKGGQTDGTPADGGGAAGDGSADADVRRLHLHYVGQVQGVGFRWTARTNATALGLTGWVRNEWDGSVTMELQGPYEAIQRFFSEMVDSYRRYPIRYTIDEREEIPLVEGEGRFSVRY